MQTSTYFELFFDEKEIDRNQIFTVQGPEWGENIIPAGVVIDAIKTTTGAEADKIADTLRRLDFANASIVDYLRHLAQGLAR